MTTPSENLPPTPPAPPAAATPEKQRLFTFASGGWVVLLAVLFTLTAALWILWPILTGGLQRATGDRVNVDSYGFDLSNLSIPRATLRARPVAKDEIHAIVQGEVDTMNATQIQEYYEHKRRKLIVDTDRVIGVVINGEARAYPLRVLAYHELCNDQIGDTPIAVTYAPLCDSVVVFDRRIAGETLEFRNSGLMHNYVPLFFDKRLNAKDESLWSQLLFQSVAGPAKSKQLTRINHALTTWGAWHAAHPNSRLLIGLARYRENKKYDDNPYSNYFQPIAANELKFDYLPDPDWNDPKTPRKTPIVARLSAEGKWIVTRAPESPSADLSNAVHAFIFAWNAIYPHSDFSAIK